nr:MAG TPA: hypothetical protein [Bacteriophage sp.]DAO91907.1 MAG TPA: hypothetical protein [Caudoviricetes sp.]
MSWKRISSATSRSHGRTSTTRQRSGWRASLPASLNRGHTARPIPIGSGEFRNTSKLIRQTC